MLYRVIRLNNLPQHYTVVNYRAPLLKCFKCIYQCNAGKGKTIFARSAL